MPRHDDCSPKCEVVALAGRANGSSAGHANGYPTETANW